MFKEWRRGITRMEEELEEQRKGGRWGQEAFEHVVPVGISGSGAQDSILAWQTW